jgi:hypothetical protein
MKIVKYCLYALSIITLLVMITHIAQFYTHLNNPEYKILDVGASVNAWFFVQFCSRTLFLVVGYLILKLIRQYELTGFYDSKSLILFNYISLACICIAILESGLFSYNIYLGLSSKLTSLKDVVPIEGGTFCPKFDQITVLCMTMIRFVFNLFIGDSPQTMYFIMALAVLAIKQFVKKALVIHSENQAFI